MMGRGGKALQKIYSDTGLLKRGLTSVKEDVDEGVGECQPTTDFIFGDKIQWPSADQINTNIRSPTLI
jgi:hypothetical protein